MRLQKKLDEHKTRSRAALAPATVAVMRRATEDLRASGLVERALTVGDTAPDFVLPDTRGREVGLKEKLERGVVVLTFFRGVW